MTYSVQTQRALLWSLNYNEEERQKFETAQIVMGVVLLLHGLIMYGYTELF
tara:strand:- start:488 stop:640 length:153 start_codon:yes stop_codon:yes gene_type:complete